MLNIYRLGAEKSQNIDIMLINAHIKGGTFIHVIIIHRAQGNSWTTDNS